MWVFAVVAVCVVAPVVVALVKAINADWTPLSDDAVIATRAYDVLSGHSPLVGQWSQASPLIGEPAHGAGPLLYWLLAVPARVAATAMVVTMAGVAAVSVIGALMVAQRLGGVFAVLATGLGLVATMRSLPPEVPYEIWNPWAGIFPLVLVVFVSWWVGTGHVKLLPVLVLIASYVVQCDLAYVIPVAACLGVALVGLGLSRREATKTQEPLRLRPWVVLAVLAAVMAWSAPAIQQVTHSPGNLHLIWRLATDDHEKAGIDSGWGTLTEAVGVTPLWTRPPLTLEQRLFLGADVGALRQLSTVLILAAIAILFALSVLRRHSDAAVALALSAGLCAAVAIDAASVPGGNLGYAAHQYVLVWISAAGMFVWLALTYAVWRLLGAQESANGPRPVPRAAALLGCAAIAVVAAAAAGRSGDSDGRFPAQVADYAPGRATNGAVLAAIGDETDVLIRHQKGSLFATTFERALVYSLRRHGIAVAVADEHLVTQFGSRYRAEARPYALTVTVAEGASGLSLLNDGDQVVAQNPRVTVTIGRR